MLSIGPCRTGSQNPFSFLAAGQCFSFAIICCLFSHHFSLPASHSLQFPLLPVSLFVYSSARLSRLPVSLICFVLTSSLSICVWLSVRPLHGLTLLVINCFLAEFMLLLYPWQTTVAPPLRFKMAEHSRTEGTAPGRPAASTQFCIFMRKLNYQRAFPIHYI